MSNQAYKTCTKDGEATLIERKSRFIGYISHIDDEEEARAYIGLIREMHPEANHHVWCYILNRGAVVRASDDGEPSGTAGRPVSEVLLREGITDVVCVVVRYFGGILLGAGGLIRAYASGAKSAIDNAIIAEMVPMEKLSVTVFYHQYGKIQSKLTREGITIDTPVFGENVSFHVILPFERVTAFQNEMKDMTAGQAICEKDGIVFKPKEKDG